MINPVRRPRKKINPEQLPELNSLVRLKALHQLRKGNFDPTFPNSLWEVARRGPWSRNAIEAWVKGKCKPTIPNQIRLDTVLKSMGY